MIMKKILKEWKSFLTENEDEISPTSTMARGEKYISDLQKRDISKKEALRKEAAYRIVNALEGFGDKAGFIKQNQNVSLEILDSLKDLATQFMSTLKDVSNEYFNIYMTGAQREKVGSRDKETSVVYVLAPKDFPSKTATFEETEDLSVYAETMDNMVEDGDFDFGIFKKPTDRKRFFDTKERSFGQGTGGVQKPPSLSRADEAEFESMAAPWFKASQNVLSILDRSKEMTPKEWYETLLAEAEASAVFFEYLADLWTRRTDPKAYFNSSMIFNYKQAASMAERDIARLKKTISEIQPTAEETVEDLMAKARAGDKEAAKEARKMLIALKRTKEAREMRALSR